tara:strand:- start:261 stop:584 length:324 start_codon:yes stop_codon:yes gene_type:complete
MAHRANINFTLYTGFDSSAANSYEAFDFMQTTGVEVRHLHYNNPEAVATMLQAIKTWFPDEASLKVPFVTYEEAYDWDDTPARVPKVVVGLDNIKAADWAALSTFRG